MATWKAVSKLLKVRASDCGGGQMGILLKRGHLWFQVSDVFGTEPLGWTVNDEDGKNYGQFSSEYWMEDRTSEFVARLIRHWAAEQGFTF